VTEQSSSGLRILGVVVEIGRARGNEQPRAVLVAWDTLEVPIYRHEKFPAYQSGREFDDALLEQLEVLSEFVAACGFQNAKAPGFEADDLLAAAAKEEKRALSSTELPLLDRTSPPEYIPTLTPVYPRAPIFRVWRNGAP